MTPHAPPESFKYSEEALLYLLLHQFATEETQDFIQSLSNRVLVLRQLLFFFIRHSSPSTP